MVLCMSFLNSSLSSIQRGKQKKKCWICENLKSLWPEDSSSSFKVKQSMTRRQIFSFVLYLHSGKLCYMGKISRENPLENGSHEKMRRHAQFHTSFMLQNPSLRMRPSELFFSRFMNRFGQIGLFGGLKSSLKLLVPPWAKIEHLLGIYQPTSLEGKLKGVA